MGASYRATVALAAGAALSLGLWLGLAQGPAVFEEGASIELMQEWVLAASALGFLVVAWLREGALRPLCLAAGLICVAFLLREFGGRWLDEALPHAIFGGSRKGLLLIVALAALVALGVGAGAIRRGGWPQITLRRAFLLGASGLFLASHAAEKLKLGAHAWPPQAFEELIEFAAYAVICAAAFSMAAEAVAEALPRRARAVSAPRRTPRNSA